MQPSLSHPYHQMKFFDLYGRQKSLKNYKRYSVDWNSGTRSKGQTALKKFLYPYWGNKIVLEEMPLVGSRMTFDIVCITDKVIIEFDGVQHSKFIKHFHGSRVSKFLGQIKRDLKKEEWAEINDFSLVRVVSEKEFTYDFFLSKGVEL